MALIPPVAIAGASNTGPIQITTGAPHNLASGAVLNVTGVLGNTAANGSWTITVTGAATFNLNGSNGNGVYGGGGAYTCENVFALTGSNGAIVLGVNAAYGGGGVYQTLSAGGTGSGAPNVGSPLVGILQWGVGGGQNQVEFDIPNPKLVQLLYPTAFPQSQPMSNTGMGVQVGVSASHISFYARNDSNLAPLASAGANTSIGNNILPAKIIVFVSPGEIDSDARLERTIYIAEGIAPLAAGAYVTMSVPPFAKKLRIQRAPAGTPVGLTFSNNVGNPYRNVDLGPNDEGDIPLDPNCQTIVVINTAAVAIPRLQAVFDVKP
jgi:hypothetical protein